MAYLDELIARQAQLDANLLGSNLGGPRGAAYSMFQPEYNVATPQYVSPSPYSLAQAGYRLNDIIYALIQKRRKTMANKSVYLEVNDISGEHPEAIDDHPLKRFMRRPNPYLSGRSWLSITELITTISGACIWEKERDILGRVIALWPMRPDWCSYMAGQGKPIRAVRYQPYGMAPRDIAAEDLVIIGIFGDNFDPLYPMLKPLSPLAVALREIGIDNDATDFLKVFFQEGAQFSAQIVSPNSIPDQEAERLQSRIAQFHGGARNWARILVLSNGAELKPNQFSFKDMAFPELDDRTVARLCTLLDVPPILIGAKVGLSVTYKNYEESHKGFMREFAVPEWQYFADELSIQLLPEFESDIENKECDFDTSKVEALQEDRQVTSTIAFNGARANVLSRNQALEEVGKDPVDFDENGEPVHVYVGVNVREVLGQGTDVLGSQAMTPLENTSDEGQDLPGTDLSGTPKGQATAANPTPDSEAAAEAKKFTTFAKKRIKEGKAAEIASYEFKHLPAAKQQELIARYTAPTLIRLAQKVLDNA